MSRAPRILYDCDTGIDDAMTLLYLASLVRAGEAELAGVGTVHGNIDPMTGALNTLRVLEAAGVKAGEQGVPVAARRRPADGAGRPLRAGLARHGRPRRHPPGRARRAPGRRAAAAQIVRMAHEAPGELTLLATGPLTNLGAALLLDDALPSLIREVVVMGGAFDHPGNITTHAEANIWHDPEAADLVFAADWPVVLVPLDATHPTAVHDDWLDRLAAHGTPVTRFAASILEFYADAYTPTLRRRGAVIHDALAAMLVVDPDLGEYAHRPVRVELRGELTRGTTVWDARSLPAEDTRRPVKVAVGSDVEAFKERLLAALTSF
ncbi:nucleoside hydrolase [Actinomadura madurae]|uniref:nucleoside hydrolase n=1 Tax=Actinomadura madurae TaxID=1993 RepID=UPI0020D2003F|nr:nucleoside hydrolase [Actinomadura madurae]MCP9953117.1 nucleoside hydrolase [Actinomadura madurae]MCP9969884.1 nucleoside hydrolase [Actinomadura madurae]